MRPSFVYSPLGEHRIADKRIMRYLKGTQNHGLLYKKINSSSYIGYSDSGVVILMNAYKSTSGYIFQIGAWYSNKLEK